MHEKDRRRYDTKQNNVAFTVEKGMLERPGSRGRITDKARCTDKTSQYKKYIERGDFVCFTLLLEQSSEWNTELWLCLVDFEKAVDTVEHFPLWAALEELGATPAAGRPQLLQERGAALFRLKEASNRGTPSALFCFSQ